MKAFYKVGYGETKHPFLLFSFLLFQRKQLPSLCLMVSVPTSGVLNITLVLLVTEFSVLGTAFELPTVQAEALVSFFLPCPLPCFCLPRIV